MKKIIAISLLSVISMNAYAVDWTADIKSFIAYPSGKVNLVLENVSNPNPASSVWSCTNSLVTLGSPANSALTSLALTLYTLKKQIRIGVTGTGTTCTASYITGS
jgi:hypothetical protein